MTAERPSGAPQAQRFVSSRPSSGSTSPSTLQQRAASVFYPVKEETRAVDCNGYCLTCHEVATAWGDLLKAERERAGTWGDLVEKVVSRAVAAADRVLDEAERWLLRRGGRP